MKQHRNIKIAAITSILLAVVLASGFYFKHQRKLDWDEQTVAALKSSYPDDGKERMLAEVYWSKYPDVGADPYFGKGGRLGFYGAREHFLRHGTEGAGRKWPTLE